MLYYSLCNLRLAKDANVRRLVAGSRVRVFSLTSKTAGLTANVILLVELAFEGGCCVLLL